MSRHAAIFLLCFALGAVLTLVVRTISHQPYTPATTGPLTKAQP